VRSRRESVLVLGLVGQYPMAGVAWQAVHHLVGLQSLGWEVYYVEDSGAAPYDPRTGGRAGDCTYAVRWVDEVMRRFGFESRWAYRDLVRGETHGLSAARLDALYGEAAAILNLCGATAPREEHRRGARLLYVETDPVYEQLQIARGASASIDFLAAHDVLFTYGENLGTPACPVPLERFAWRPTRPPVVPELWETAGPPATAFFTSIASWENRGKDVTWEGVTYRWTKHVNFLRVLDLPRRVPQRLRLAMDPDDPAASARLAAAGWELVDPGPISRDLDAYRRFIADSRGEFTVAKDIYVRPRSGWFSDRSVCYLAAGRPVVTQDTGFGRSLPTGRGLVAWTTPEEAAEALARVDADWAAHAAAARRIAVEHFSAERVLGRLLADAGL
jgi:Glycosyl transferases group 1